MNERETDGATGWIAPGDAEIRAFLATRPVIAMVGASSRPERPSHGVMADLLAAGCDVIPVNPNETEVLGVRAFPSLAAIGRKVDLVDVFRREAHLVGVAHEAVAIGARMLWLQIGLVSPEAYRIARAAGMMVVMDQCLSVERERLLGSR
jgi:predicted CoA-binding protein